MAGSLLEVLKQRREELVQEQIHDLTVPLWTNPTIRFRVKPLDHGLITRIMGRIERAKGPAMSPAALNAHASIVAAATVEVVLGDDPDDQVSLPLDSPALREALELPEGSNAAQTVRGITLRDGDTIALGLAVIRHSGFADEAVTEALQGE